MAKPKDPKRKDYSPNWGGARPNSGGLRPNAGRPNKIGMPVEHYDVRIPPEWHEKIKAYGNGNFTDGLIAILKQSGVVE